MYFPVLRAKQNELIGIRELADRGLLVGVTPVLEPVRDKIESLLKTISQLNTSNIDPIVIINPSLGDFANNDINFLDLINSDLSPNLRFMPCVSTKNGYTDIASEFLKTSQCYSLYFEGRYSKEWEPYISKAEYVLVLGDVPPMMLRTAQRIIHIADGFQSQSKNSDYPDFSNFNSNWHTEYKTRSRCIGFGDYTIINTDYSESGGPAYVVALHLTYIDSSEYDAVKIRHFKSYDDKTPTQPGLKFKDALDKLIIYVGENKQIFVNTFGLSNFYDLHAQNHFPGLGQVKKNSIQHHIETIANYIKLSE